MGELNDLFVARADYQELVEKDPTVCLALGWIAARIELVRSRQTRAGETGRGGPSLALRRGHAEAALSGSI